ncbi:MAG: DUF3800 domain-containing protein [Thermodesulfobacteriota bacterium]
MHLLYLDDSGSSPNPTEEYLVLGGLSVYEAQAHWFTQEMDRLAQDIHPANPHEVEFHASEIFSRRNPPWNRMSRNEAQGVIKAVLRIVAQSYETARVFACAVHKPSYPRRDPMEIAFEDLCSRFDLFLTRMGSAGDRQRGLIILDESTHETSLQSMARNFRVIGTKWGSIRNLADTPLFIDSRASRLTQIADHISYSVFRRYQSGDTQYFDIVAGRFDSSDGIIHGLSHKQNIDLNCMCPACLSRRSFSRRSESPYQ